jgi:hypothetical protein
MYLKFHKKCQNSYRVLRELQNDGLLTVKEEEQDLDEHKEIALILEPSPALLTPKSESDCNEDEPPNDRFSDFENAEQPPTNVLEGKRSGRKARQCNVCGKIVQRLKGERFFF